MTIQDRLFRAVRPGNGMKTPVLCASTGNIALTSATTGVDGVTPSSGDRILVWQQTNAWENGIYNYGNSTWERALDFDGNSDVVMGTLVPVSTGARYRNMLGRVVSTGSGNNGGINFTGSSTSDDVNFSLYSLDTNWSNRRVSYAAAATASTDDNGATIALSGAFYTLTFAGPSSYDTAYNVTVVNESTARAKSVALNGGDTFKLYPGQVTRVFRQSTSWRYEHPGLWKPSSAPTFYVDNVNGSDSQDGLGSSAAAWATVGNASITIHNDLHQNGGVATVQLAQTGAPGTPYTENAVIAGQSVGGHVSFMLVGDEANPQNYQWSPASGTALFCTDYVVVDVKGIQFNSTGAGIGVLVNQFAICDLKNIRTGSFVNGTVFYAQEGGKINISSTGTLRLAGSAPAIAFQVAGQGCINLSGLECVIETTGWGPSDAFFKVSRGGDIRLDQPLTFTNSTEAGSTGKQYDVTLNGTIALNGTTFPTVWSTGTTASGGIVTL